MLEEWLLLPLSGMSVGQEWCHWQWKGAAVTEGVGSASSRHSVDTLVSNLLMHLNLEVGQGILQ